MKHAASAEDKKARESQAAEYRAEQWIRVTLSNGNTRMMKRAEYNAMKKED